MVADYKKSLHDLTFYSSGGDIIQAVMANGVLGREAKWITDVAEIEENNNLGQKPQVFQKTNGQFPG